MIITGVAHGACRDCAQSGFGGPAENRFTAYDAICRGDLCRSAGFPQVFVNTSDLTLFVKVTDLAFGGPAPGFSLDRFYNQDDSATGVFGTGWSFTPGDRLTPDADGVMVLRRGSGHTDQFAASAAGPGFFAVSATDDTLTKNSDGTYTLRSPGSSTAHVFGANGRLQAIQDAGSTRVSLDYNASGNLTAAHYRGRLVQFTYDANARIKSVSDSAGRTLSYSYSADGRLTQQTNPDGQTLGYQYDDSGNLTSIAYAGATIAVAYSGDAGYAAVSSVTTGDGAVRKYDIPLAPTQIRLTDGNGDATLYASSASGLLLSVTDANGNSVSYTYDSAGRRVATVNGSGETLKFTYDGSGNLTGAADAAGNRWSADYTPAGPAHITDPNGNVWTLKYDASGNLASVSNPAGGSLTATRSAAGLITSITNGLGNKTGYQYNSDGLLAGFVDALTGSWAYQYDGAARASSRTDPGGTVLEAAYNPDNRITGLTSGTNKIALNSPGLERDSLNRLVSYTDSFGNQVTYQYDGAGQLNAMTLPGGKVVTYRYDHARRLSVVSDWLGNFALYRYDPAGWPVSVSVSGGPVTIYQYDSGRRLRAIVSTGPDGSPVAGYRYTLDANGNRTAISALEPNTARAAVASYSFTLDAAGHPVSRSDGQTYQYDARGNLSAIQGSRNVTLGYDAFGRLQTLSGDTATAYAYDTAGLRVVRTVNGTERRFVYDLSAATPRVVMEADRSNTPIAWYVYGLGLLWKVTAAGTAYFYHFDGDGNVVAVSNAAAGVVNQYRYDAAGRLASANEGTENMFRARGEAGWVDDGNGLIYGNGAYQFPELRLTLPATADPSPPVPGLLPQFSGAGACFFEGVAACQFATGRRER